MDDNISTEGNRVSDDIAAFHDEMDSSYSCSSLGEHIVSWSPASSCVVSDNEVEDGEIVEDSSNDVIQQSHDKDKENKKPAFSQEEQKISWNKSNSTPRTNSAARKNSDILHSPANSVSARKFHDIPSLRKKKRKCSNSPSKPDQEKKIAIVTPPSKGRRRIEKDEESAKTEVATVKDIRRTITRRSSEAPRPPSDPNSNLQSRSPSSSKETKEKITRPESEQSDGERVSDDWIYEQISSTKMSPTPIVVQRGNGYLQSAQSALEVVALRNRYVENMRRLVATARRDVARARKERDDALRRLSQRDSMRVNASRIRACASSFRVHLQFASYKEMRTWLAMSRVDAEAADLRDPPTREYTNYKHDERSTNERRREHSRPTRNQTRKHNVKQQ